VERGRRLEPDEGRRYLLRLTPRVPLQLLDLHDIRILTALDLDERNSVGDDYPTCQAWALAFYEQYQNIDGIRYRARKAGAVIANVMLYADRCRDDLDVVSAFRLDESEEVVLRAADRYRLTVYFPFRRSG
jgi:hypothetical protein